MSVSATSLPTPCNKGLLSRYLEATLLPQEQFELENHLNMCVDCRQSLESLAADGDFWDAATKALDAPNAFKLRRQMTELSLSVLASAEFSADTLYSDLLAAETPTESTLTQTQMLRRWLDPSDREESLGRIGKYEVLGIVGQGGMGLVLKALDTELDRMVALKTLAHHITSRSDARLRLAREARAAAALRHPNVVSIFGMETWRDVPLIVMPLVDGGTLHQFALQQRLSIEQILTTALQIASALAALHEVGIVHRDLKPSNILLQDGLAHVLLSDFGLARFDGDLAITHSDAVAGTPFFMSPEQALGKTIDARSDLFSFGSVLYWLCTGKYPFRGNSNYETLSQLVNSEADVGELERLKVPEYVQRLIQRLVAKEPSQRWSSAEEVVELLRGSLAHYRSPDQILPNALKAMPPASRLASSWTLRITAALIVVIVIGIGFQQYVKLTKWPVSVSKPEGVSEAVEKIDESTESQQIQLGAPRYGALDELDRRAMLADLERGERLHYWLRRLAYLTVDGIPPEAIPAIQKLAEHNDSTTRELSQVILNKNPFQEVIIQPSKMPNSMGPSSSSPNASSPNASSPNASSTENPFQEVLPNE